MPALRGTGEDTSLASFPLDQTEIGLLSSEEKGDDPYSNHEHLASISSAISI